MPGCVILSPKSFRVTTGDVEENKCCVQCNVGKNSVTPTSPSSLCKFCYVMRSSSMITGVLDGKSPNLNTLLRLLGVWMKGHRLDCMLI